MPDLRGGRAWFWILAVAAGIMAARLFPSHKHGEACSVDFRAFRLRKWRNRVDLSSVQENGLCSGKQENS